MTDISMQLAMYRWEVMLHVLLAGNYDSYLNTRAELEDAQMKKHKWEQDQIAHMKEYIARFGHGSAKLARQAQSKEKTLEKMVWSFE